jgi:nucleoside-diphosphate-sugar epimerase
MNIIIFGGAGFIGSCLSKRLSKRSDIRFSIFDKNLSKIFPNLSYRVDISKNIDISNFPPDTIFVNLAAEHRDNVSPKILYDQVNVTGAKNLCELARKCKVNQLVFTSSVAIYGFAPIGTDELGLPNPFNDYGRTKLLAENIYKEWQAEDPLVRSLVIIRPTVVFGEQNRGNVYNLLRQISSGLFIMIGNGLNRKSIAYVENVAAFIEFSLNFKAGIHVHNYIDKPDFSMNSLVAHVQNIIGKPTYLNLRIPLFLGILIGRLFDFFAFLFKKKYSISTIRVMKFVSNSVYESSASSTGFVAPVELIKAIENTVKYEFIEENKSASVYYSK